jgi:hypothetical protein
MEPTIDAYVGQYGVTLLSKQNNFVFMDFTTERLWYYPSIGKIKWIPEGLSSEGELWMHDLHSIIRRN